MIQEDVLRCAVCSREVRIVRLVPGMLTLGHVQNPRQHHHQVRLSRSATSSLGQGDGSLSRVPDASAPERAGTRGDGAPSSTRSDSDPLRAASSSAGRRVERGSPRPRSASARSAGSVTAGEGV